MSLHETCIAYSLHRERGIFFLLIIISILIPPALNLTPSLYPETDEKNISVKIEYKGAFEKDIEKLINRLEQPLSLIRGLKTVYSVSEPGKGTLYCSFSDSKDYDEAYMEVRDSVNRVYTSFPENVQRPVLSKSGINNYPVFAASFPAEEETVHRGFTGTRFLKNEFEEIKGCGYVETGGFSDDEIIVVPDFEKIISSPFQISDIINRIREENFSYVITPPGRKQVKTGSRIENKESIKRIYLENGLKLSDITAAGIRKKDHEKLGRIDGLKTLILYAFKEGDCSTIEVCRKLKIKTDELGGSVIFSRGSEIEKALSETVISVTAGIAAVIITALFYFRQISSSILVILNILFSILASSAALKISGGRLDIISLSGTAVVSGLAIDNSIIILEKFRVSGSDIRQTVQDTYYPLLFSFLTSCAVFIPLLFASEKLILLFKGMAVTVISGLSASFLYTFYFIPLIIRKEIKRSEPELNCLKINRKSASPEHQFTGELLPKHFPSVIINSLDKNKTSVFQIRKIDISGSPANINTAEIKRTSAGKAGSKILKFILLKTRIPFLMIFLLTMTSLILINNIDYKPFNFETEERFTFFMEFPAGTSTGHVNNTALSVEKRILEDPDLSVILKTEKERARFDIKEKTGRPVKETEKKIRNISSGYRNIYFHYPSSESAMKSYDINIYSDDTESAAEDAYRLGEKIKGQNSSLEVIYHFKKPAAGFKVIIDTDKTGSKGKPAEESGRYLWTILSCPVISKYYFENTEKDIRFGSDKKYTPEMLKKMVVGTYRKSSLRKENTGGGEWNILSEIAELKPDFPPGRIYHRNRQRVLSLSVSGKDADPDVIENILTSFNFSSGCRGEGGFKYREDLKEQKELLFLISLSFFFILTVLAVQFESFKLPLLISSGIPASFALPLAVMIFFKFPFSISAALALILSAGICVNNSILILSSFKGKKECRAEEVFALLAEKGGAILTASLTTVLSIIPLIFTGTNGLLAPFSIILASGVAGSLISLPAVLASACSCKSFI